MAATGSEKCNCSTHFVSILDGDFFVQLWPVYFHSQWEGLNQSCIQMPPFAFGGLGYKISYRAVALVSCAAAIVFWCKSWCICVYLCSVPT